MRLKKPTNHANKRILFAWKVGFDNKEQKIRKIYIYLAFNVYLLIKPLSSNNLLHDNS